MMKNFLFILLIFLFSCNNDPNISHESFSMSYFDTCCVGTDTITFDTTVVYDPLMYKYYRVVLVGDSNANLTMIWYGSDSLYVKKIKHENNNY